MIANAWLHAAFVVLAILGLFYYWFGIADRYAIFLYDHLGATPFDAVTSGRYWMAGLVASGMVMIAYTAANWLLGRIAAFRRSQYGPPEWWKVWSACAPPLAVGILIITMSVNSPRLPFVNAVQCVLSTLVGVALALWPAAWAARRPLDLAWLMVEGTGLMPCLLLLRAVELPGKGLQMSDSTAYLIALGSVVSGVLWGGVMAVLRARRRKPPPSAWALFAAGLVLSYLCMPVVHYFFFTPADYRYISATANFFADRCLLQMLIFGVAAGLAPISARLQRRELGLL